MAVQLVSYEIRRAHLARAAATPGAAGAGSTVPSGGAPSAPLASPEELQRLYAHLGEVLEEIDFRDRTRSGTHLMMRIRRFLQRAELDQNEVNILRGFLTAVQSRRRAAGPR